MAEPRRGLSAALKFTPEETQFIRGGNRPSPATEASKVNTGATRESRKEPKARPSTTKSRRRQITKTAESLGVQSVKGRARVAITTRFHQDTADFLRRASLERKLRGESLHSQQDIIERAVLDWLTEDADCRKGQST